MSDVLVIYPRALVSINATMNSAGLLVPFTGDPPHVTTTLYPDQVTLTLRQHHQASECEVKVVQSALPFDPRRINSVFVTVYLAAMPTVAKTSENDQYIKQEKFIRFVGYADTMEVERSIKGPMVSMKCRDLSSVFRDEKNLVVRKITDSTGKVTNKIDPIPRYVDSASSVAKNMSAWTGFTSDQLEILDHSTNKRASKPLTQGTNFRGQKGRIPIKNGSSAWDVIEHVAALSATLVNIDKGSLVFRDPAAAWSDGSTAPPKVDYRFVFGDQNKDGSRNSARSIKLKKKFLRNRKGVRLVAWDPDKKRRFESIYPVDSELAPKKRAKLDAKHQEDPSATNKDVMPPDRDIFTIGDLGINKKPLLDDLAKRIYTERSRQEMEGELETAIWDDGLFNLKNGSRIEISINPALEAELNKIDDINSQVEFLSRRMGLNRDAAYTLLVTFKAKDTDIFYVRNITYEWTPKGASAKIDFITLIEADIPKGS